MTVALQRKLSNADMIVLGVGGAVGTGVLFSSAGMAADAGPAVVLAWILGGIFYAFIGLTFVELGILYPEAGGPSRYSLYTHGRAANLINAFSDLIWYLFIPPVEALAAAEGLNYFYPHLVNAQGAPTTAGAVVGALLMLLFLPFNYYGIKAFSRFTNALGGIKLVLYVLAALGFISFARFGNFTQYRGGFAPFGLAGIFAAIPLAMFAFGGIRVIPDYAEEAQQPRDMRHSIMVTVVGQTIIYLLFSVAFVAALNWSRLGLKPGHWPSVTTIPGNPFLVIASHTSVTWLIILTVIIAIVGPFVTGYIYQGAGSRVLFAMGRSGIVSARMTELSDRFAIPKWSLIVFTVVGIIVAYIAAPLPSIYSLITDAVVAGYIGFAINPVAMLALRRQNGTGPVRGGNTVAVLAFAAASLITYWSGWPFVPYAVVLLAIFALGFGLYYHAFEGVGHALWYIVYILFLTGMTYIGGVGALNLVNLDTGSVMVVLVSVLVFLPWGVSARMDSAQSPEPPREVSES